MPTTREAPHSTTVMAGRKDSQSEAHTSPWGFRSARSVDSKAARSLPPSIYFPRGTMSSEQCPKPKRHGNFSSLQDPDPARFLRVCHRSQTCPNVPSLLKLQCLLPDGGTHEPQLYLLALGPHLPAWVEENLKRAVSTWGPREGRPRSSAGLLVCPALQGT